MSFPKKSHQKPSPDDHIGNQRNNSSKDEEDYYYSIDELVEDDLYRLRQQRAYLSIAFSLVQTVVLIAMMVKCGVAPFRINPMFGPYPGRFSPIIIFMSNKRCHELMHVTLTDGLDYWGAKNAYKILNDDEYWRLMSPILLHGGVIHLLSNIVVQLDTCAFWEKEWGSSCWLAIYLTSGLGSSMMSVIFKPNNVSVGSSGAVMGLFGGKIAEIICRCRESSKSVRGQVGRNGTDHYLSSTLLIKQLYDIHSILYFSSLPSTIICVMHSGSCRSI
jgi:hypothetical protein